MIYLQWIYADLSWSSCCLPCEWRWPPEWAVLSPFQGLKWGWLSSSSLGPPFALIKDWGDICFLPALRHLSCLTMVPALLSALVGASHQGLWIRSLITWSLPSLPNQRKLPSSRFPPQSPDWSSSRTTFSHAFILVVMYLKKPLLLALTSLARFNSRWALAFLTAFLHTLTTSQVAFPCFQLMVSPAYVWVLTGVTKEKNRPWICAC